MLTDNAVELTLHKYAVMKNNTISRQSSISAKERTLIEEALGRRFDNKLKLAKSEALLPANACDSIEILHSIRNKAHHVGAFKHEALYSISLFYFLLACDVLSKFDCDLSFYNQSEVLPYRAKKYLGPIVPAFPFKKARATFRRMRGIAEGFPFTLVRDLGHSAESVIDEIDRMLGYLSATWKMPRNEAVLRCQAMRLAFSGNGDGNSRNLNSRTDPVPVWRRRVQSLVDETDIHKALKKHRDFLAQSENLMEDIRTRAARVRASEDLFLDAMQEDNYRE